MKDLSDMLAECRNALIYVKGHINGNKVSADINHWVGVKKRLEEKIDRLEECIKNGEYYE
tara:strand:+ start:7042 stop:7221 length:180 start_codon:yes stop_codon:yes gene_type:complete